MKLAAVGAVLAAIVVLVALLVTLPRGTPTKAPRVREVASACGPDVSTSLSNYFNALAPNSTITLPHNGCFTINSSLHIAGVTGLTLNGNGASLNQAVAGPESGPIQPILFLTQDTNLKISNLTIDGAFDGSNGGDLYEGNYGISMEGDTNVTMTGITDENIQGDCLLLQAANDITPSFAALNIGIVMTKSTLNNCGYHGVTLEATDGFTLAYSTIENVDLDAIDAEVDGASTYFVGGQPQGVAEDNIKILNDTWKNFGDAWYVSLQGQTPGVQQQNVTLSGNTLNSQSDPGDLIASSYVEVLGTVATTTTSPYLNIWLTITNNKSKYALAKPYDETGPNAIPLDSVSGVNISNNVFPVDSSTYAFRGSYNNGLIIRNNTFAGAVGVNNSTSHGATFVIQCGNHYGPGGSLVDATC